MNGKVPDRIRFAQDRKVLFVLDVQEFLPRVLTNNNNHFFSTSSLSIFLIAHVTAHLHKRHKFFFLFIKIFDIFATVQWGVSCSERQVCLGFHA